MTDQPLSPAAQAVLDATGTTGTPLELTARGIAAAALRAAADQVVPQRRKPLYADTSEESAWSAQQDTREELLAIAAELDNSP
jgi:ribulose 1,5-bisphosphate synthetase/thiazole synthase